MPHVALDVKIEVFTAHIQKITTAPLYGSGSSQDDVLTASEGPHTPAFRLSFLKLLRWLEGKLRLQTDVAFAAAH